QRTVDGLTQKAGVVVVVDDDAYRTRHGTEALCTDTHDFVLSTCPAPAARPTRAVLKGRVPPRSVGWRASCRGGCRPLDLRVATATRRRKPALRSSRARGVAAGWKSPHPTPPRC